jgi:hypothetical protein
MPHDAPHGGSKLLQTGTASNAKARTCHKVGRSLSALMMRLLHRDGREQGHDSAEQRPRSRQKRYPEPPLEITDSPDFLFLSY